LLGRWCKCLVCGLGRRLRGAIAKNTKPLLCGYCNMFLSPRLGRF